MSRNLQFVYLLHFHLHHFLHVLQYIRNFVTKKGGVTMFSDRLDQYLNERHISNYKISKATGIANSLIGYWRKGVKTPTLDNLILLCDYLDVPIDYLACRMDQNELDHLRNYRKRFAKEKKNNF